MSISELPGVGFSSWIHALPSPADTAPTGRGLAVVPAPPVGALTLTLNHDTVVDASDLLGAQSFSLYDDRITFVVGSGEARTYLRALIGDRLTIDDSGRWARVPRSATSTS